MRKRFVVCAVLVIAVAAAAVAALTRQASAAPKLTNVTLQLKWVPQAQFAGYYAALQKGYYKQAGLNVTLKNGGPNIIPETVVASGQAQFGLDWLPSLLSARDKNTDLVNIAQVFARSGMTEITWKNSGITTIGKMKGKKVGNWLGGNQYELFAALSKNGMSPAQNKGVTIVAQGFTMDQFLKHQIDAASAMTYNELAQVLETKNPSTGKLYTLSNLNVIHMQQIGTAMLEDGLFSTDKWLKDPANQATAVKFIAASLKGWIYCRDHLADCVNMTLKQGSTLPKGHQTWMMNEINKLVWPADSGGIGMMDKAAYQRTAKIAQQFGAIKKPPTAAYRTDLAATAIASLKSQGLDVNGKSWKPAVVHVTPGGK